MNILYSEEANPRTWILPSVYSVRERTNQTLPLDRGFRAFQSLCGSEVEVFS